MHKLIIYMMSFRAIAVLLMLMAGAGITVADSSFLQTDKGARYKDLVTGSGPAAGTGDVATMHFVGWLDNGGAKGREFFDSRKEGAPVSFVIGTEWVMPGWNEGIVGMQPGGRRLLMLPPSLAYGDRAVADVIPANASLIFVIELIELRKKP
jgi:FKBP-type peptidyl-prolyl cis-trans isomerase